MQRVYLWIGDETRKGIFSFLSNQMCQKKKNYLNPIDWIPVLGMSRAGREYWKDLGSVFLVRHGHYHWCTIITTQRITCSGFLIIGCLVRKSWIQVLCLYLTNSVAGACSSTSQSLSFLHCSVWACLSPRVLQKDGMRQVHVNGVYSFCFKWRQCSVEWVVVLLSFGFKFLYILEDLWIRL